MYVRARILKRELARYRDYLRRPNPKREAKLHRAAAQLAWLGERGGTLSGGQRQRIAIAPALVRDTPLLLLDEPTTDLDAPSEAEVVTRLERLMAGRTALLISHKLTLVERADLILVLDGGSSVERGTDRGLLARGQLYARLYAVPRRPLVRTGEV